MLNQGYAQDDLPTSQFLKLVAQQVLEQEVVDCLGREGYERQPETTASGHRYTTRLSTCL